MKIVTVPGLHGSGPLHWQTRWERRYGFTRIEQDEWDNPVFSKWEASLLLQLETPGPDESIVFVAHSLGCHLVVKSLPRIGKRIGGIFLVAPPDLNSGTLEVDLSGFADPSATELGERGYLVYSQNDPYATVAFSEQFARSLGIASTEVGFLGHINSDSGLGDWDEGYSIFKHFLDRVPHSVKHPRPQTPGP
jgi:uncharacterized protein